MPPRVLTALAVYNEAPYVNGVLDQVRLYSGDVLVVDDGSTDTTAELLAARDDICVVTHDQNRGYGAALKTAFDFADGEDYNVVVTIDCDGQHEPQRIPHFIDACRDVDIVSGSRYLKQFTGDSQPPADRRLINEKITSLLNRRLDLCLTDAFCGFKAYQVAALRQMTFTEPGYAMPLELWVQAVALGLRITELPVPLIYLEERRSFGGTLDAADVRIEYYHLVLERSISAADQLAHRASHALSCKEGAG